ncbi:lysine N(6)-hydroxylase/L-ornithine N(5)-oxygenase family protein [Alkalicoccobacillus murimartini]|uniref:L-lysine N6-monooxygenase MbtG n=1 Tax=Alkalicoccobacillus murimartini TaxID=171685 RepID=A0ABT9YM96_9BACI|nr:SidA/IucD/PvdA family monooxygenase [Alkalicoccobacillus murimartini]MDQ0208317.1 lysine N6-hydroxylase [Alkalicoccobacillus murimartini]
MHIKEHVDLLGVGIGPFNLGLAALLEEGTNLTCRFFDQQTSLRWHPGMLIDQTDLQVPFLADLVTFANPKSSFTFLNYLHEQERLYAFYFFKRFDIPRKEYNAYLQWAAAKLTSCQFGVRVDDVEYDETKKHYLVTCTNNQNETKFAVTCKHIVMGTGSVPLIPGSLKDTVSGEDLVHSSEYLQNSEELKRSKSITIVGSGQSAAEIFYELLEDQDQFGYELSWFTRSAGFFQMEEGKLGLEMFSPEYVEYFHELPFSKRKEALPMLGGIRNGVQVKTLKNIYDLLYHRSIGLGHSPARIQAMSELDDIKRFDATTYELSFTQSQTESSFTHHSEKIVMATGYEPNVPKWFHKMKEDIIWESDTEFAVELDGRVQFKEPREANLFALTNVVHAHATSATNLQLAVQRNQRIINQVTGEETYPISRGNTFQQFF